MSNYKNRKQVSYKFALIAVLLLVPVEVFLAIALREVETPGDFFGMAFFIISVILGAITKNNINDDDLEEKLEAISAFTFVTLFINVPLVLILMSLFHDLINDHDLRDGLLALLYIFALLWGFCIGYGISNRKKKQ